MRRQFDLCLLPRQYATGSIVPGSAVIGSDDTVYFISRDGNLYALNPDGSLKWSYAVGGGSTRTTPAIGKDGTIFAMTSSGTLYALTSSGPLLWSTYFGGGVNVGSPAVAPDGTIYVGAGDGYLYAVQSACGGLAETRWPKFRQNAKNTGRYQGGVMADTAQAAGTTVTINRSWKKAQTAASLQSAYSGLADFTPASDTYAFNATVSPNEANATFYFLLNDINGTVSEFWLYKLKTGGETLPFAGYSGRTGNRSEGCWWVTDKYGTDMKTPASILNTGTTYRVYYTIGDNGAYDLNSTKGALADPVVLGRFPVTNGPNQAAGVLPRIQTAVSSTATADVLAEYTDYSWSFEALSSMSAFNATVTPAGSTAVFRFNSSRLSGNVSGLALVKFFQDDKTTLNYNTYANASVTPDEGFWWITARNNTLVKKNEILFNKTNYFINFAVKDNGVYDTNPTDGVISDPLSVGLETTAGSTGGCMLNPDGKFSLEWLLFIPAVFLWRMRRRPGQ